jgi:hypothetical protein
MDRDSITRTGARAPGVERVGPLARRCLTRASSLTQSREYTVKAVGTKDDGKPGFGKALSDIPALKPYRENSPYGILGEAMETSASFEARSAPLPYPTLGAAISVLRWHDAEDSRSRSSSMSCGSFTSASINSSYTIKHCASGYKDIGVP